ncbi:hypothetical protein CVT24_000862 [Panaeolus cyanescens]|uniref:G domain-containing protein n=1 Tax=Panaeolus cyanescens TaxID=181874 RepID=A0A409WXW4_9AGAR|nr:hypothetical protein CVT24_000862 [Panaeolus cyanescens]
MEEFRRREPKHLDQRPYIQGHIFLLIGPTGSGKSSVRVQDIDILIPALASNRYLGISKDQLEGVTQEPQGYHLINATWRTGEPIYLIDTPGLSDRKLSEVRVFSNLHSWLVKNGIGCINGILYFDRITDIRMSGTRWRAVSSLLQAVQKFDHESAGKSTLAMFHVTTMWDTLPTEGHWKKAERRFEELEKTMNDWHSLPNNALFLGKFLNTQTSALDILDMRNLSQVRGWPVHHLVKEEWTFQPCYLSSCLSSARFSAHLWRLLMDRIVTSNSQLHINSLELRESEYDDGIELMEALLHQRSDIADNLRAFTCDQVEFIRTHTQAQAGKAIFLMRERRDTFLQSDFGDISAHQDTSQVPYVSAYEESLSIQPSDICEEFMLDLILDVSQGMSIGIMIAADTHDTAPLDPQEDDVFETSNITIDGLISIERVDEIPVAKVRGLPVGSPDVMAYGYFVLLIGPTGSGKSSFVEAIGDTKTLGISKDQLEGVTQEVQAYQLMNTTWVNGDNIYLIDTPGLADEKISETRLFKLIRDWMKTKQIYTIHRILYFDRITDIRMSSSRWRSIETLIQAIQGFDQDSCGDVNTLAITHITTMWDTVINENQKRKTEVRFEEVKSSISEWHALPDTALHLGKFVNTQNSAISILDFHDLILIRGWKQWEPFQSTRNFSPDDMKHDAPSNKRFASFLYRTLLDRIRVTNEQLQLNSEELRGAERVAEREEVGQLSERRREMIEDLQRLEKDREDFVDMTSSIELEVPLDPSPIDDQDQNSVMDAPATDDPDDSRSTPQATTQIDDHSKIQGKHGDIDIPPPSKRSFRRKLRTLTSRLSRVFPP